MHWTDPGLIKIVPLNCIWKVLFLFVPGQLIYTYGEQKLTKKFCKTPENVFSDKISNVICLTSMLNRSFSESETEWLDILSFDWSESPLLFSAKHFCITQFIFYTLNGAYKYWTRRVMWNSVESKYTVKFKWEIQRLDDMRVWLQRFSACEAKFGYINKLTIA